jgi:hypothetical protein
MHFAERYLEIFHYVLDVTGRCSGPGAEPPDFVKIREGIDRLMEEERQFPLPPGYSQDDRKEALFPVIAWIDERLMTFSKDHRDWQEHSLQRAILNTNQGGTLFFDRLGELLDKRLEKMGATGRPMDMPPTPSAVTLPPLPPYLDPSLGQPMPGPGPDPAADAILSWASPGKGPEPLEGILDVFALCLLLGFKGRYSGEETEMVHLDKPPLEGALNDDPTTHGADKEGVAAPAASGILPELTQLAKKQLQTWKEEGPTRPEKKKGGFLEWLMEFFWEYDWVFIYLVLPITILGVLFLRSVRIIQNLPF